MSEPESSAEASSAGSSSSLLQTLQKTFSARPSRSAAEKDFAALCAELRDENVRLTREVALGNEERRRLLAKSEKDARALWEAQSQREALQTDLSSLTRVLVQTTEARDTALGQVAALHLELDVARGELQAAGSSIEQLETARDSAVTERNKLKAAAALEMAAAAAARTSLVLEVAAVASRQPVGASATGGLGGPAVDGSAGGHSLQEPVSTLSDSIIERELQFESELRMSVEIGALRAEREALRLSSLSLQSALAESQRFGADAHRRIHLLQQQQLASQQQQHQGGTAALIWWSLFGDSAGTPAAGPAAGPLSVEELMLPVQRHLANVSTDRDRLEAELARVSAEREHISRCLESSMARSSEQAMALAALLHRLASEGFQWWSADSAALDMPGLSLTCSTPLRHSAANPSGVVQHGSPAPSASLVPVPEGGGDGRPCAASPGAAAAASASADEQEKYVAAVVAAAEDFLASPSIRGPRSRLVVCSVGEQSPAPAPASSLRGGVSSMTKLRLPSPVTPEMHLPQIAPTPIACASSYVRRADDSEEGASPGTPSPPAQQQKRRSLGAAEEGAGRSAPSSAEQAGAAGQKQQDAAAGGWDPRATAVLSRWLEA